MLRYIYFICSMNLFTSILQHKVYKNTLEDWLIAISIIILTVVFARLIYWLFSKLLVQVTKRTATEVDDTILKKIDTPIVLGIILIGFRFSIEELTFSRPIENYLQRGFVFATALTITWLLTRIVRALIEQYFKTHGDKERTALDAQMVSLAKRAAVVVLWLIGITLGLNNAGFDVGALIAGLGIGGLALALAAQDTVKNIIGGLVVFLDKPFYIGDNVKIKDMEGTVVYTGMRSTRIRTPAGRVITIPNAQFTDNPIENITLEPSKRVVTYLGLVYETPPAKVREAIAILRDIATTTEAINLQQPFVFLERFNESSLDINFTYFIRKNSPIQDTQTEVNLQILQRFNQAGLSFAYPTQTSYETHIERKSDDTGKEQSAK